MTGTRETAKNPPTLLSDVAAFVWCVSVIVVVGPRVSMPGSLVCLPEQNRWLTNFSSEDVVRVQRMGVLNMKLLVLVVSVSNLPIILLNVYLFAPL